MDLVEQYQRMKRRGALMVWTGIIIIIGVVALTIVTTPQPQPDFSKLGIHLLLDDGRGSWDVNLWDEHIAKARDMLPDDGYVLQLVRADDLDTAKWQIFMDLARDNQLTPIIRLATNFDYDRGVWSAPQADEDGSYRTLARQYADFIAGLDWHNNTHYIILLNEVNNGHEWDRKPEPKAYARFVLDVAPAIKNADEEAIIVNAAMDLHAPDTGEQTLSGLPNYLMSAERFMDAMFEAEPDVFKQFDRWNSHAYPLFLTEPPNRRERGFQSINGDIIPTNAPADIYNRSVNGYEWELWKLSTYGVAALPVMITETGWNHSDDPNNLDNFPSPEEVTRYMDMLLTGNQAESLQGGGWRPLLTDDRVIAVVPFALDGKPDEWDHINWLKMSPEGEILGEYPMVELFKGYMRSMNVDKP